MLKDEDKPKTPAEPTLKRLITAHSRRKGFWRRQDVVDVVNKGIADGLSAERISERVNNYLIVNNISGGYTTRNSIIGLIERSPAKGVLGLTGSFNKKRATVAAMKARKKKGTWGFGAGVQQAASAKPKKPASTAGSFYSGAFSAEELRFSPTERSAPITAVPAAEEAAAKAHLDALVQEGRKPVTVATVEKTDCRWPVGDPRSSLFSFCGAKVTSQGFCYCDTHIRAAWQNPPPSQLGPNGEHLYYLPFSTVKRKPRAEGFATYLEHKDARSRVCKGWDGEVSMEPCQKQRF